MEHRYNYDVYVSITYLCVWIIRMQTSNFKHEVPMHFNRKRLCDSGI